MILEHPCSFELQGTPPFFYAHNDRMVALTAYRYDQMTEGEAQFLRDVITACCGQPDNYIDYSRLALRLIGAKKPHSKPLVEKRIRQLKARNLLTAEVVKRPGKRSVTLYRIAEPSQHQKEAAYEDHRYARKELEGLKNQLQAHPNLNTLSQEVNPQTVRTEGFIAGYMDRVLRPSNRDPRKSIEALINYKNEPVKVTSFARSDGSLMTLSDQRHLRAIISIAAQMIETDLFQHQLNAKGQPELINEFGFDIADVCHMLGRSPCGSARDSARAAIDRIHTTNWRIEAAPNGKFATEVMDGLDVRDFQVFTEFGWISGELGNEYRKPRFYRISFNRLTFEALKSPETRRRIFVANPKICSSRSGIIQSLYNFARMYIGAPGKNAARAQKAERVIDMRFNDFQARFFPMYAHSNFYRDFHRHLAPFSVHGSDWTNLHKKASKIALVLGYFISLSWNNESRTVHIKIVRDPEDGYVGDYSPAKRLG